MIIVYKEPNKNNKLEFTKKEIEDLIDKAYQEGYKNGFDSGKNAVPSITPYYPTTPLTTPTTPINPWKTDWTCSGNTNTKNIE